MATAVLMPKAGASAGNGKVLQWLKKVGEQVLVGDPILKIESDNGAVNVRAEISGVLLSAVHSVGDMVPAGQPLAYVGTAEELKPETPKSEQMEILPVSRTRKIIAERLSQSMFSAPHYYLKLSVDAERLIEARDATADGSGKKVSINAFLIKFVAEAMKRYPMVNSSWRGDSIALFKAADIGLAVAQPEGLITPVVRDCGAKDVFRIDEELQTLIRKALNRKLLPSEYSNATFTVSNLGSFGIEEFTAVINPPGSAILAVGAMRKEPVVDESGKIVARTRLRLTLSCDHRVIDGAVGAKFLKQLGDFVENPAEVLD